MTEAATSFHMYPDRRSANIQTWVGFKALLAMMEQGVLAWFRAHQLAASELFHRHGVELDLGDISATLTALLNSDDRIEVRVRATSPVRWELELRIERDGVSVVAARGRARARARKAIGGDPLPSAISALPEIVEVAPPLQLTEHGSSSWRARYYDCQYSRCVQHSRYVAALEEAVDEFLAERSLGIRRVVDERGAIPVVSRVQVTVHADALMDELVHTRLELIEILKNQAWDSAMHCWVERDHRQVLVASARILHGYAHARGPESGCLMEIPPDMIAALRERR